MERRKTKIRMNSLKILWKKAKTLDTSISLGQNRKDFLKEIYFLNLSRIKKFAVLILLIEIPLLYFDFQRIHSEIITIRTGGRIVLYSRLAIISITLITLILALIKNVEDYHNITLFHKILIQVSYFLLMLSVTFMAIGDEMISGSIIVFFGAIFTFSILAFLKNIFSFILYFFNSFLLFIIMDYIIIEKEILLTQRINLTFFTILVWIVSRYLFYTKIREYQSRKERENLISELQEALENVKTLSGLLPICSGCKKIRDDKGYWNNLETYIHEHSEAAFSHSICPECQKMLYADTDKHDDIP